MLLNGKESDSEEGLGQSSSVNPPVQEDSPPPLYEAPATLAPSGFPPSCNSVVIRRTDQSIKEKFAIDPMLVMPEDFLPPLEETETIRPNLKLQTTNGAINVDVLVLGDQPTESSEQSAKRALDAKELHTILVAHTTNGSLVFKLLDDTSQSRAPLDISISTKSGSATLYIPRSFNGPLVTTTSHGATVFTPGIKSHATTFHDIDNTKTSFVGTFSNWKSGEKWMGDTATVKTSHGRIKIAYVDEYVEPLGFMGGIAKLVGL